VKVTGSVKAVGGTARASRKAVSRAPSPSYNAARDQFIEVARPCVLLARPASASNVVRKRPGQTLPGQRPGFECGEGLSRDTLESDDSTSPRCACNVPSAVPQGEPGGWRESVAMASRHDVPSSGNWVRLSAAQQVGGRHAITLARGTAKARTSFGAEPRRSDSERWAHQTPIPFTRRNAPADGAVAGAARLAEVVPGSFLPVGRHYETNLEPERPLRSGTCHNDHPVSASGKGPLEVVASAPRRTPRDQSTGSKPHEAPA